MFWFGPPREGDWVVARRDYSAGVIDSITGAATVRKGDRGVVVDPPVGFFDPHLRVRFDTGWATREIHLPVRVVRVISRGRGETAFDSRVSTMRWIRLGALLTIVLPVLWYVAGYRWRTGSLDGITTEFAIGTVYSVFDMIEYLITDPIRALLFLALSWVVWKVATGRLL